MQKKKKKITHASSAISGIRELPEGRELAELVLALKKIQQRLVVPKAGMVGSFGGHSDVAKKKKKLTLTLTYASLAISGSSFAS